MFLKGFMVCVFICNGVFSLEERKTEESSGANSVESNLGKHETTAVINNNDDIKQHILMFHPWGTPSHKQQLKPLILGLLEAGNEVTAALFFKTEITHQHYTEIVVEDK